MTKGKSPKNTPDSDVPSITVVGPVHGMSKGGERGFLELINRLVIGRGEVPVKTLRENIQQFLQTMEEVVKDAPHVLGNFKLDSLTVSVEVGAKGTLALLGTGGELSGKGGITFVLKPK